MLFPRAVAPAMYDDLVAACRAAGFSPRIVQEAMGSHTLVSLVGAGVGLGFVPRSLAGAGQSQVVFRPVRDLDVRMALAAAWKSGDRSPVRERFVTVLRAVAGAGARGRQSGA